jgi:hypothetical protein
MRTLYAESVGVKSKDTIARALAKLESSGVITTQKAPIGSRKATQYTWALTCPEGCQVDHANGNRKLKSPKPQETTRPTQQETTRPTQQDALRVLRRERTNLISFIYQALKELPEPTSQHLDLIAAIDSKALGEKVEELAKRGRSPYDYIKAIAISEPWKLLPKPKPEPDYSHLPPTIAAMFREADLREADK